VIEAGSNTNAQMGQVLLGEMQEAYGGKERWLSYEKASFSQIANWYGDRLGISGWDTLPQQFEMTSYLGTDNSQVTLLNGPNSGQTWAVKDWKTYRFYPNRKVNIENVKYQHKLIYKNYWFQFPFRISEAPIIYYGGQRKVNGETYDLLYATWGSEKANRSFDQYLLYLDPETKLIEWLHFTLREKVNFLHLTAQFDDFKEVNGIIVPFTQYVSFGSPGSGGLRMHENRYQWIQFGDEKVARL